MGYLFVLLLFPKIYLGFVLQPDKKDIISDKHFYYNIGLAETSIGYTTKNYDTTFGYTSMLVYLRDRPSRLLDQTEFFQLFNEHNYVHKIANKVNLLIGIGLYYNSRRVFKDGTPNFQLARIPINDFISHGFSLGLEYKSSKINSFYAGIRYINIPPTSRNKSYYALNYDFTWKVYFA